MVETSKPPKAAPSSQGLVGGTPPGRTPETLSEKTDIHSVNSLYK